MLSKWKSRDIVWLGRKAKYAIVFFFFLTRKRREREKFNIYLNYAESAMEHNVGR